MTTEHAIFSKNELLQACHDGAVAVVKALIDKGANVNAKIENGGITPLWIASQNGHEAVVRLLLANAADPCVVDSVKQYTPLMIAALKGHTRVVRLLADNRANVNAMDGEGSTPLMLAALEGHPDVAELLLAKGANVDIRDVHGLTALMIAALKGQFKIMRALLDRGADVNATDEGQGYTALMIAALKGYRDAVQNLLEHGANVNAGSRPGRRAEKGDRRGVTALMLASQNGHNEVVQLLESAGASQHPRLKQVWNALTVSARRIASAISLKWTPKVGTPRYIAAESVTRLFEEESSRVALLTSFKFTGFSTGITGDQLEAEMTAFGRLGVAFRKKIPRVADMVVKTASEQCSQQYQLRWKNLKLFIATIPTSIEKAQDYFNESPRRDGYVGYIDHLRGDAKSPNDRKAQVFAAVTIIVDLKSNGDRCAVHICLLPNGLNNEDYCPVAVWPVHLLTSGERHALGLAFGS